MCGKYRNYILVSLVVAGVVLAVGLAIGLTLTTSTTTTSTPGRRKQIILKIPLLMNLFSSRRNNYWWLWWRSWWSSCGGWSVQSWQQEDLPPTWPPGKKVLSHAVWPPPLWGRHIRTILPDVESSHWKLHPNLSHTQREEISSLVLEYWGGEWPHLINGRSILYTLHWISQPWRFLFNCQF